MRGRTLARIAALIQLCLLAGALIVPSAAAAATFGFTLNAPSLSTVQYSDFVVLKGSYTCVNDASSDCTASQSRTATFSVRPSGGSTFTNVGTINSNFFFVGDPAGCPSMCTFDFQLTWKAGRAGSSTTPPGTYDIGLTTTIAGGQQVLTRAVTITKESTNTTYTGATAGQGGADMSLAANVSDADLGLAVGTGVFSPDTNLLGAGLMTFELFDTTNTTSVAGPVSAIVLSNGNTSGSPLLHLPAAGGSYKLRTTFVGNSFYTTSSDLDTVTVTASNTPPVLTVPASPVFAEASSPAGAYRTFTVSATDAEDSPAPTPTCDHASGDLFPIGDTVVSCSVTDSGGLSDSDSFTIHVADTTDPVLNVTTDEDDNGSGWFNIASNDDVAGVTVQAITSDLVGVTSLMCTVDGTDVGVLAPTGGSFAIGDGSHVVECTATDGAGNHHTDSASFDVDQTAPSVSASISPSAADSGWWNTATGAPTVTYACSDAGSGLVSCSAPHLFGEGADQADTGTALDAAGNTASASVSDIDVDLTAPSITSSVSPDVADTGWWNASTGGPTVTYSCSDDVSGVATCSDPHLFGEGSGQGDTGTAIDAAGNSATTSVVGLNVDTIAPSISASLDVAAADSGWWNLSTGAPTVSYSCSDAGSGLATCSSAHLFGEGVDQGDTGIATDVAGNAATASVTNIDVDLTAPSIAPSIALADGGSGWWNLATGAPTVTYLCADAGSGVASCASPHQFGEGIGLSDTGSVVDHAGNSASASVSNVQVDLTAPTISASVSPAAASTGWWNASTGAPTAAYLCSDDGSGVASCSPAHVFGQGSGQSATGFAVDVAGNGASATVSNVRVDLTAPGSIAFTGGGLTNGGSYVFGSVPAGPFACTASDAVSGLASCVVSGYSTVVGPHTITAVATDVAGNSASTTLSYTVLPWTLVGFSGASMTSMNQAKAGSSVNLKFQVFAGSVEQTSLAAVAAFTQTQISCSTLVAIGPTTSALASPAASLKFASQFQAKWDPPSTANTCWQVAIVTADGSSLRANFQLK
ncbi:MAG TPA: PxKF domain-containing protein [Candidatus Limnocylindrales bacterium]|nr:PxKF domain-containing protein [Candidatus Limnocylindrales bacterium]